jgi:hypothetical protein
MFSYQILKFAFFGTPYCSFRFAYFHRAVASQDYAQPPLLQVQLEDVGSDFDDPLINQFLLSSSKNQSQSQSHPSTAGSKGGGRKKRLSRNPSKQTAG